MYLRAIFQVQAPGVIMFGGAKKQRVSCVTGLGGLYYFGGAYFRNITVTEMSHLVDLSKF